MKYSKRMGEGKKISFPFGKRKNPASLPHFFLPSLYPHFPLPHPFFPFLLYPFQWWVQEWIDDWAGLQSGPSRPAREAALRNQLQEIGLWFRLSVNTQQSADGPPEQLGDARQVQRLPEVSGREFLLEPVRQCHWLQGSLWGLL